GAGVGVRALTAHRQPAPMPQPAIAGEVHQTLDVHGDLAPEVALDSVVAVDALADADHLIVGQRVDAPRLVDPHFPQDLPRLGRADPVDILQADHHALGGRYVDAGNTSQIPNSFNDLRRATARP